MKLFAKFKVRYEVIFCVKEGNSYNFLYNKTIKADAQKIVYKSLDGKVSKTIPLVIKSPTFRRGNVRYYCIDIVAKQIHFAKIDPLSYLAPEITNLLIDKAIIEQLARATTKPLERKFDLTACLIGAIIGGLGGFLIAMLMLGGYV